MANQQELSEYPGFDEKLKDYIQTIPPEFKAKLEKTLDGMSFEQKCKLIKYTPPPKDNELGHSSQPAAPAAQPEPSDEDEKEAVYSTNKRKKRRALPIRPRETKALRATPANSAASAMLNLREREIQAQRAEQQLRDRDAMEREGIGSIQRRKWQTVVTARMPAIGSAFAFTPGMCVKDLINARDQHTPC
jgi:hypothetical protein